MNLPKRPTRMACDNCGAINPPTNKDSRVTTCCLVPGGLYTVEQSEPGLDFEERLGSNGKTTTSYFRFPFHIEWHGFWDYMPPRYWKTFFGGKSQQRIQMDKDDEEFDNG